MIRTWQELVEASHGMAKEKGWWDKPRSTTDIENNFHGEISEAWEEYRAGRMATWYGPDGKPEGFFVELGDLLVRLADACGGMPEEYFVRFSGQANLTKKTASEVVSILHNYISLGCHMLACAKCFDFAHSNNVDLWAVIHEKMAYNANRPHRHGGKIA